MKKTASALLVLIALTSVPALAQEAPKVIHTEQFAKKPTDFRSYWYRGLAEMNRFEVKQSRYGELHDGEWVVIFVTEDFLTDKQVKHEFGPKTNAVPAMKMLNYRRFWTGIYPYNITTAAILPVKDKALSKLTFTETEWCGQVFAQLNKRGGGFDVESRSYFQAEGDRDFKLAGIVTEDELWTRLRLDPASLPLGDFEAIPSLTYLRLNHQEMKAYSASAKIKSDLSPAFLKGAKVNVYTITFKDLGRSMSLYYEPTFPYRVVGFEEVAPALFNPNGGAPQTMTTTGVLAESIMLDYWAKHSKDDAGYRKSFGLKPL